MTELTKMERKKELTRLRKQYPLVVKYIQKNMPPNTDDDLSLMKLNNIQYQARLRRVSSEVSTYADEINTFCSINNSRLNLLNIKLTSAVSLCKPSSPRYPIRVQLCFALELLEQIATQASITKHKIST
ncbi:hypothetical protein SKA34_16900 [Photobacterium sp. SKA34]|uniref:hypothetical protein n=1 Tax=Photobacterium sp. SKA34 TaxID=121723 RepID=UPI00006BEB43|nr:hypothetical protein [Photobacterium sp. SKA34]EAR55867.1 hypothetical protein SKA34_16900 [Photobacterium sp. SKA34]